MCYHLLQVNFLCLFLPQRFSEAQAYWQTSWRILSLYWNSPKSNPATKIGKKYKIQNNNKTMQLRTCKIDLLFRFSDTIQYVQQPLFWFLLVCFWVYQSVCKDSKLSIIYREYNMISSKSGGNTCPIGLEYSVGKLLPKTTCQQQKFFICMSLTPSLTWLPVCTSRDWL